MAGPSSLFMRLEKVEITEPARSKDQIWFVNSPLTSKLSQTRLIMNATSFRRVEASRERGRDHSSCSNDVAEAELED